MPIGKIPWLAVSLFACSMICSPIAIAADWQSIVQQGDQLYSQRSESEGKKKLEDAIKKYEEALKEIPKDNKKARAGVYIGLARADFKIARYFAETDDAVADYSDKGQDWAKKAIDMDSKSAEAHYWMGANLGIWRGVNKASFRGGLMGGGIKKEFEKAAELDPKGLYGLPDMRIAEYLLARGDAEKAQGYAEKAVKIAPEMLVNKIMLAEILWKNNNQLGSKKLLNEIVSQKDDVLPGEILENRETITRAKRVLNNIANHNDPDW